MPYRLGCNCFSHLARESVKAVSELRPRLSQFFCLRLVLVQWSAPLAEKQNTNAKFHLTKKVAEGGELFKLAATTVNIINNEYKLYKKFRLSN